MALSNEFVSASPSIWKPDTLEAAWQIYETLGLSSRLVAGGTWLRTQWESDNAPMPHNLISLASISEMTGIQMGEHSITIGAGTTLNELRRHLLVQKEFPHLIEAIRSIAAPSIRNMATLGGNILTFVGDTIPVLLVIGAELNWYDGVKQSSEPLQDWLSSKSKEGYPTEKRILISIQLPLILGRRFTYYHKVGRREAFTPSLLTVAYQGCVNEEGKLYDFRISAGGGTAIGMRLTEAEYLLKDKSYSITLLQKLQYLIREQFITYSDVFASAQYRKNTAANLISAALWKALEASI